MHEQRSNAETPGSDETLPAAGVEERTRRVMRAAAEVGFTDAAAAPIEELDAFRRLREWVGADMHGSMGWIDRTVERRTDPRQVLPDARSMLVVALDYDTGDAAATEPERGRISRYAWGDEYHAVMEERLERLEGRLAEILPGARTRSYVDHGPVMEKAWAARAGLGFLGKHTNLISRERGSWFFLGAVLLDVELEYGSPEPDGCGGCRLCIEACPTDAIVAPYVLDARRCIAYLTIENRGPIPRDLRAPIGNRVFGCDECQDVCPWNEYARRSGAPEEFAPREGNRAPALVALLQLDEEAFRARFPDSPVRRAGRDGFVRNVAVALGNCGEPDVVPALLEALEDDSALVRGHVAWALGEIGTEAACVGLRRRRGTEEDAWVLEEIDAALHAADPGSPT